MVQAMTYWSRSSRLLTTAAEELGLQIEIINKDKNLFEVIWDHKRVLFKSTDFWENSALSLKIANDKWLTYDILKKHNLPTTETHYVSRDNYEEYLASNSVSFPCIIKPLDDGHGNGVETNINDIKTLLSKLQKAFESYNTMIIQKQISWEEYRFMVLRWKVIAVLHRIPASVTWDNIHTIQELIALENTSHERGEWYNARKTKIQLDTEALHYLKENKRDLDYIPKKDENIRLRGNSNFWTGGEIENVTPVTHKGFFDICETITELLHMGLCGVDIMCQDITQSPESQESIVLEINATPGIMSWKLVGVDIAKTILETLFEI